MEQDHDLLVLLEGDAGVSLHLLVAPDTDGVVVDQGGYLLDDVSEGESLVEVGPHRLFLG